MTGIVAGVVVLEGEGIMLHLFAGSKLTVNGKPYIVSEETTTPKGDQRSIRLTLTPIEKYIVRPES